MHNKYFNDLIYTNNARKLISYMEEQFNLIIAEDK